MKILLCDFSVKVGKEDILKLTIGNESWHEISNDSRVRAVNMATSKNLTVKSVQCFLIATFINAPGTLLREKRTNRLITF
jgi:hypothetical protein